MSVKELIAQIYEGDAYSFKSTFDEIMSAKMEAAIGAKYDAMFAEAAECDDEDMEDDEEEDGEDEEKDEE